MKSGMHQFWLSMRRRETRAGLNPLCVHASASPLFLSSTSYLFSVDSLDQRLEPPRWCQLPWHQSFNRAKTQNLSCTSRFHSASASHPGSKQTLWPKIIQVHHSGWPLQSLIGIKRIEILETPNTHPSLIALPPPWPVEALVNGKDLDEGKGMSDFFSTLAMEKKKHKVWISLEKLIET